MGVAFETPLWKYLKHCTSIRNSWENPQAIVRARERSEAWIARARRSLSSGSRIKILPIGRRHSPLYQKVGGRTRHALGPEHHLSWTFLKRQLPLAKFSGALATRSRIWGRRIRSLFAAIDATCGADGRWEIRAVALSFLGV